MNDTNSTVAYIIGVALGDGNLSNPNRRATRLRITCDSSYPKIANEIFDSLRILFPNNKVSYVKGPKDTYFNISVYSNKLNDLIPWKVGAGSKSKQKAHVPTWILNNKLYWRPCLRGLIQTDGSIYLDRGYKMLNFTNNVHELAEDTLHMMKWLGYQPRLYQANQKSGNPKYTVRLSRDVDAFIEDIELIKA